MKMAIHLIIVRIEPIKLTLKRSRDDDEKITCLQVN